jgi:hypothetical protein
MNKTNMKCAGQLVLGAISGLFGSSVLYVILEFTGISIASSLHRNEDAFGITFWVVTMGLELLAAGLALRRYPFFALGLFIGAASVSLPEYAGAELIGMKL